MAGGVLRLPASDLPVPDLPALGLSTGQVVSHRAAALHRFAPVVIGIGLNLLTPADQLPLTTATSLLAGFGLDASELPPFDELRADIVASIASSLGAMLGTLCVERDTALSALRDRARAESYTLGRRVEVTQADGSVVAGVAQDIRSDTALLVRMDDGNVVAITAGDVGVLA